jgi:fucose permease
MDGFFASKTNSARWFFTVSLSQYPLMPPTRNAGLLKTLLHIIFFLSGIATVLIGPILPVLARHFTLSDLQVSFFFPAQFAGSVCGTLLSSRFAKANNYLSAAMLGGVAMGCGELLLNFDSYGVCIAGFMFVGLGVGLTLPSINMMVVEINPERAAAALSVLNFCWGLGAIISKPFVDLFSTADNLGLTTVLLAVPLLVFSVLLRVAAGPVRRTTSQLPASENEDTQAGSPRSDDVPIWRTPLAWAIALFNFIHVGFESGMGGWLTTYTGRLEGEPVVHWLSPTLLYFSLFVIGRGIAPVLFRYLNENKMLFLGLGVVLAGMVLTLSAGTVIMLSLGSAIAGFGTSWIFPTNVARFSKTFGPAANRRATPLFVCGTFGAALATWLIGFLSDRAGSLRAGMFVLIVSIVLLIALQIAFSIRTPSRPNQ